MTFFGESVCPHCQSKTRFLLEKEGIEGFYMLGDTLPSEFDTKALHGDVTCDYCYLPYQLHVMCVENVVSAFLAEEEVNAVQKNEKTIQKAIVNAGLEAEENGELWHYNEMFSLPFAEQPMEAGETLQIKNNVWTIQKVYKKESTERDVIRRMMMPASDEYWYEVTNENGEKKWCFVSDTKLELLFPTQEETTDDDPNAILTANAPFLKEKEMYYDVTDSLFRTTCVFEQALTDDLFVTAYDYLAGVRLIARTKEQEIEYDLFGDTIEDCLDQLQDLISVASDET